MFFITALANLSVLTALALPSPLALPGEPGPAPAPQDEGSLETSIVEDDLEFVVNLARHRYFDLANEYVEGIKVGRLSAEEKSSLLLTNASVLKLASEYAVDEKERLDAYNEAIRMFQEFVDYNTHHPRYNESRLDLAKVKVNLAKFLGAKLLQTEDPTEIEKLKEQCEAQNSAGIELLKDVIRTLENNAEALQEEGEEELAFLTATEARKTKYEVGRAYYHWGLIYDAGDLNREDYLNRAVDTLDEYIWDSPEDDFFVLWAFIYQSMAYMELGSYPDAIDLAKQVYDPQTGVDLDQATILAPEYAKLITELTETSYHLVAQIYTRMDELEMAIETVDDMVEKFTSRNLELGTKGYLARLVQAEALIEMNDPAKADLAAQVCTEVSELNPTNDVGKQAKIILNSIIDRAAQSGGMIQMNLSPSVLLSAADGAKLEKKFSEAIGSYMKVLEASTTPEHQKEFNGKAWYGIGECYIGLNQHLEAAAAHEQGYLDPVQPEDKTMFEKNAMSWYGALTKRYKATRDSFDEKRMKSARDKLVQMNVSTDLRFIIATDKFTKALVMTGEEKEKMLQEALDEFNQMDKQSNWYERSLVYRGRCYYEMGKYEEALKEYDSFRSYIDKVGIPSTTLLKKNRRIALAEESYYRSENFLKMERFNDVLITLDNYEGQYKSQPGFFPVVIYNRILAKVGLERFDDAIALYKQLGKEHADSNRISMAAYYMALGFNTKALSLLGDGEKAPPKDYIKFLKLCADYMYQHCEKSGFNSFTNLKNVCEWYKELGELGEPNFTELARTKYELLLKEFGKNADYKDEIYSSVYRGYGEVLLTLQDFVAAKPIWLRLLNANKKSISILRSTAKCLGGWLEYKDGNFIEIPGAGVYMPDPSEKRDGNKIYLDTALGIWRYLLKGIDDSGDKYSPDWWEAKFNTVYVRYRAGAQFPEQYELTKRIIDNQKIFREDMGGPDWRKKFTYIEKTIKRK